MARPSQSLPADALAREPNPDTAHVEFAIQTTMIHAFARGISKDLAPTPRLKIYRDLHYQNLLFWLDDGWDSRDAWRQALLSGHFGCAPNRAIISARR